MKTFLKLTVALFALGFATANAELSDGQKAAIKAVTDAVATGDESKVKAAVSAQVAAYPEITGEIVSAGLKVTGVSEAIQNIIVKVAAWTAPAEILLIKNAIGGSGLSSERITELKALATRTENAAKLAGKNRDSLPPPSVS